VTIHLGVHNHLITDGKCWEFLLIAEELDYMPDVMISTISLSFSKTFMVRHLLNDFSDSIVELLKGEQLEKIQDNFYELSYPNIRNLVASFKHHLGGGYIDNILELKFKSRYDYI
jgi:hypothetical protein